MNRKYQRGYNDGYAEGCRAAYKLTVGTTLFSELTVANNRLGNAVGALIDAGTYCAGYGDIANGIERVFNKRFDEGREVGFKEGYLRREAERVALATANSELRSKLHELTGSHNP